jgi:hypothetical protein
MGALYMIAGIGAGAGIGADAGVDADAGAAAVSDDEVTAPGVPALSVTQLASIGPATKAIRQRCLNLTIGFL